MSTAILLLAEAQTEFDDAATWYERQQPGIGESFVHEVQTKLNVIVALPNRFPLGCHEIRVATVSRFPYNIFYHVDAHRIVVVAIIHAARDSSAWKGRIY